MITVEEAQARVLQAFAPLAAESVALDRASGRVLAADLTARRSQPPVAVSAMDGYAIRAADVAMLPARLSVIGAAPAGRKFTGTLGAGQAVRIFTGGSVPSGADAVVIQENVVSEDGSFIRVLDGVSRPGANIRLAGLDFTVGDRLLTAGRRLTAPAIGLAAAMNLADLPVRRQPRVAILSTGDELVMPGESSIGEDRIVAANGFALAAYVRDWGGEPVDLGIARDSIAELKAAAAGAAGCDLLVTSGGASVGEHDLIQRALGESGFALEFWKVALRPGKPFIFGKIGAVPVLGLPGNPVSALVCALLFLRPAIDRLLGLDPPGIAEMSVTLGRDLPANDQRQDYMRASIKRDARGTFVATPFEHQDSSMLSVLARADGLVIRPPNAPAARKGDPVHLLPLTERAFGA
ncbi:MAG: molybdopterin molybdenumtransferase MoeA [Alphaproteobacteria bacterium]|nr:molybdopterin molybdenumtransferase MoeA [Alphaproteobacteria bacterium]